MSAISIKGFVNFLPLFATAPGQTAPVGELSKNSFSYAPEIQLYDNPGSYPNVGLVSFATLQDNISIGVPQLYGDYALQVANWIFQQSQFGNFSTNTGAFVAALTAQFGATMSAITAGNMVNYDTNLYCPEWIQYTQATTDGNTNTVRLWFADASFTTQYDLYTMRIIPPVQNVDDLFAGYDSVKAELANFDIPSLMQRVQAAANSEPYTLLRSYNFNYVNPQNTQQTVETVWTVIEYGVAGDNLDAIKAAIIDYILANTQYTQQQWAQLLPELFLSTEFIVTPRWDQYAIPNGGIKPGIYSPNLSYSDIYNAAMATAQGMGYSASGVANSLNVVPFQYKSMTLEFVAGPLNQGADSSIQSLYPDYINVPPNSTDFGRMSNATMGWVNFINGMLTIAETMTEYSLLPAPQVGKPTYSRVTRNGIYYLVASYGAVDYLMVPLAQLQALLGIGVVGQQKQPVSLS